MSIKKNEYLKPSPNKAAGAKAYFALHFQVRCLTYRYCEGTVAFFAFYVATDYSLGLLGRSLVLEQHCGYLSLEKCLFLNEQNIFLSIGGIHLGNG